MPIRRLQTLSLLCLVSLTITYKAQLPEGFVYLKDEIPNLVEDIRYYGSDNFVGTPIKGYEKPRAILSAKATEALKQAQAELNLFGLGFKIFDSYRPQQSVDHFVEWAKDLTDTKRKATYYPEVQKQHLFRDGYIASRSSHTRGSTVDLTIINLLSDAQTELDMGSAWDYFGPISWPSSEDPTAEQRSNRMLLQMIMKKYGFRWLDTEWWHFTFNDEPFPETYFNFPVK